MDIKPTKTFKLSKTTKRIIALMKGASAEQRNSFKRAMIQAQLAGEMPARREKERN
jgi:hypothetical protein